nr:reverse transcriptase domain-containing protein [Tanacetum cinerariifolium]
ETDSILEDSVDEDNVIDPNNDLVDTIHEMFTDEHTLDYSSPPLYDDLDELESDNDDAYNDPFDSKEDKIKESKLLIDELDPPRSSDSLPSLEYDSFLIEDFFEVDAFPSTYNEDKVFNSAEIARDVFVLVRKFTFLADFVIFDYKSGPRVLLILGRPFLRTARALIDVHGEKMILRDEVINPLSGSTTSSTPNHLLEEFTDELALITFPLGNDDLPFDIESDHREIEYLLNHDPTKETDSILEDSVDEDNVVDPNNDLVDTIPEMFIDEHTLDYSSPPLYDDFDDDLDELESDNDDAYNDPFDSKEDKIKESKLLIDELDPPRSSDFLPSLEYDSFLFEEIFEVDAFPSTYNEDKVFNSGILIHENLFEVTNRVAPDKNVKKMSISHASLILKDFNPPLSDHELPFQEVLSFKTLLSFSSKDEEKVFKPGIPTSKGVHTSLLLKLSHQGTKAFKVIKILESLMKIFPCSYGEDIRILDVPCLHFYTP